MVIKKPYAFLIRNFRLIHAVLFGLLLFIAVQSFGIYTFFSNYVKNHSFYATDGLANSYVPMSIFVVIVVAILVTFLIYYILSKKQKSNRAYLFIFMYCIVLFVYFIYVRSVFVGLEDAQMGIESSRAMRDISIIVKDYTGSGRVNTITINNIDIDGTKFRELTGIKSTNFRIEESGDNIIIYTVGYGHGVGMSQEGANQMAINGNNYIEIIKHYYTDVEVKKYL